MVGYILRKHFLYWLEDSQYMLCAILYFADYIYFCARLFDKNFSSRYVIDVKLGNDPVLIQTR